MERVADYSARDRDDPRHVSGVEEPPKRTSLLMSISTRTIQIQHHDDATSTTHAEHDQVILVYNSLTSVEYCVP